jgi:hypothetical protein
MTDEPTHDHQASPGYVAGGDASLAQSAEPWGVHQETGEEPIATDATGARPQRVSGSRLWPRIVGVLLLFVIVGGVWVWQNPGFVQSSLRSWFPGSPAQSGEADEIRELDVRVGRLEQRPQVDLAPLTQRLDALEARPFQTESGGGQPVTSPADLRPLLARLDTLEAREASIASRPSGAPAGPGISPAAPDQILQGPIPDGAALRSLSLRLDALERRQAEQTADATKVDALAAQINASSTRNSADIRGQLDGVEHRLGELAATQTKLAGTSDRVVRLAQMEIALAAGHPLGSIPDAPPALARFATTAPPTEAGLRLAFTAASQEALRVSLPDTEGKPFLDRILARLQDFRLITVREGDRVVIGNSTAATLVHARVLLDVGDLSGATRAVATLSGPAAEQMAPWLADATALQAAREALASLAENG